MTAPTFEDWARIWATVASIGGRACEGDHQLRRLRILESLDPRERAPGVEAERVSDRRGEPRPRAILHRPRRHEVLPHRRDELIARRHHRRERGELRGVTFRVRDHVLALPVVTVEREERDT